MKKYSVYVKFKSGQDLQFETDTNVNLTQPVTLENGVKAIITENEYVLNMAHVQSIDTVEL